jgi:hypothetical protein
MLLHDARPKAISLHRTVADMAPKDRVAVMLHHPDITAS